MFLSRRSLIRVGAGGAAIGAMGAVVPAWADTALTATAPRSIDDLLEATRATSPASTVVPSMGAGKTVRKLSLYNLHTSEKCTVVYKDCGQCVPDALAEVNHVLRDWRNNEVHPIDTRLLDLLADLHGELGTNDPFNVISGYRSPQTNAMLHERSAGVASKSLHMQGMAIDIRLPDTQLRRVRDTALAMGRGGVGYYEASNFVHVDVGRVRRWTGA
jgi:uncharacterized protein YcbK (DUF882 family)